MMLFSMMASSARLPSSITTRLMTQPVETALFMRQTESRWELTDADPFPM